MTEENKISALNPDEEERVEKDIEAIEKEKQEYLDGELDEDGEVEEDKEVDEMEFSLSEDEIEEWIIKLTELKVEKKPIELEVDEENNLKINYEEGEDE